MLSMAASNEITMRIREMRNDGFDYREIAKYLERKKVKPPKGTDKNGGKWTPVAVRNIDLGTSNGHTAQPRS